MGIVRITNYFDDYRLRALAPDFHDMAGRDGKEALTEFVNAEIAKRMDFCGGDVLVDVGCGNGKLLELAGASLKRRIGVLPTEEEQSRVQVEKPDLDIRVGLVQSLPLEPAVASKIVCNAVLLYMESGEDTRRALREIARIAVPGAKIWLGEIPDSDDYARFQQYRGTSVIGLLCHLWQQGGVRPFLGMLRRLAKSVVGRDQVILSSAGLYYAKPDDFIAVASECGLRLVDYFRHRELDEAGRVVDSPSRYDYLFTV